MVENYLSVFGETVNETVIERSRFICKVRRVESEEDARAFIEEVRREHSTATHNCYAYVASEDGNIMKFSDDGEPQGTAGMPMLEVLRNRRLMMTAAVVTRYFGGVKLGAGGLVRAYSGAVAACLNSAKIVSNELSSELKIKMSYELYSIFLKYIAGKKLCTLNSQFDRDVEITCVLPRVLEKSFTEGLTDFLLGRVSVEKCGEYFYSYGGQE